MKTRIPLFCILFALLSVVIGPQVRATCHEGCGSSLLDNTFLGDNAFINNTGGFNNTAIGSAALSGNTTGDNNTATGVDALVHNTTGNANTANGVSALGNSTGNFNTATGANALYTNSTGDSNTATGLGALFSNTTGSDNTASGFEALDFNTVGNSNTADGNNALLNNTTGSFNIAVGNNAGFNLTTGINNIDIGSPGVSGESNTIRIGTQGTQTATFIAGIRGTPLAAGGALAVGITHDGQLGVRASSVRYKEAIHPMDKTSEAILALKPVTFRYKRELDPEGIPQFGLVAEEVEKVNPDLVARDDRGKPYTVRYEAVNAMLLNEFLKAHRKIQELEANNVQQQRNFAEQQKQIEALTAGLQKVSAQLELSKPAAQTVQNDH